jgi:hypothetical protein
MCRRDQLRNGHDYHFFHDGYGCHVRRCETREVTEYGIGPRKKGFTRLVAIELDIEHLLVISEPKSRIWFLVNGHECFPHPGEILERRNGATMCRRSLPAALEIQMATVCLSSSSLSISWHVGWFW